MKARFQPFLLLVVLVAALLGLSSTARCELQIFLTIDGIPGESAVQANAIDVLSCSFNVTQAGLALAGGKGAPTKSNFSTLTIYKQIDKSTPSLLLACALGKIPDAGVAKPVARLHFVDNTRTEHKDFFQVVMSDVLITAYNLSGDTDGSATESVSIGYSTLQFAYTQNLPTAVPKITTFNVLLNRAAPVIGE